MRYEMTKDLETGNALIDSEHRQLFKAVNDLLDAPWISLYPTWLSILGMRKSFSHSLHILDTLPTGSFTKRIKGSWTGLPRI